MSSNTRKFEDMTLKEMEAVLPKARRINGEKIQVTDKEWYNFANKKFVYIDSGKTCNESNEIKMQLWEMGDIKPLEDANESLEDMEKRLGYVK